MTQDQVDTLKFEIEQGVNAASTVVGAVAPEFLPYIVIGRAVATVAAETVPTLVKDVEDLIQRRQEATPEEKEELARTIHGLMNPESLDAELDLAVKSLAEANEKHAKLAEDHARVTEERDKLQAQLDAATKGAQNAKEPEGFNPVVVPESAVGNSER